MVGISRKQLLLLVVVAMMLSTSSGFGSAGDEGKRSRAIGSSQTTIATRVAKKVRISGAALQ